MVPMLAPKSYTREDVVELQCHGSEVCLQRVLRACIEAGARLAEPGLCIHISFLSIINYCFLQLKILTLEILEAWVDNCALCVYSFNVL